MLKMRFAPIFFAINFVDNKIMRIFVMSERNKQRQFQVRQTDIAHRPHGCRKRYIRQGKEVRVRRHVRTLCHVISVRINIRQRY